MYLLAITVCGYRAYTLRGTFAYVNRTHPNIEEVTE
jgi:hypothetical protein